MMKRTKGSQSEIGMVYQYGVASLLAAKLSTNTNVDDFVIYSSDRSAGKFDDIVARVKLKGQDNWYLSLIQVKYKETKNLEVSDILNGNSIKHFLSDYIESFNKIITNPKLVCRQGINSENICFSIFCNQSIQTPIFLRHETTFELNLYEYSETNNKNKTLIPFEGKLQKFACKDLQKSECQHFFNRCYLCLEQPSYIQLNQHIEKVCEIGNAATIVNYVKDYFNNDYLYRQGLRREVFEVELQRIRWIDAIPPITSLLDLIDDGRISVWKDITLNHDITAVNSYESVDVERCLYSCLLQSLNDLLSINVDWNELKNCRLDNQIINKFVAHSKTKKLRYWISLPNTLRMLLMELWKCGDLPLILTTCSRLNDFEKRRHLKRSYIIITDWTNRIEEIADSKLKIFSNLSSICNLELQNKILECLKVSLQCRKPTNLKDLLGGDKELMSTFTCVEIIDMMKKRIPLLKEGYFKGSHYLAFIIQDSDCTDIIEPIEPYTIGGNIMVHCHPSKVNECINMIQVHATYQNYTIYQLRKIDKGVVLAEGDKCKLSHLFVDQYEDPLYVCEENVLIPIIGKPIVPNELYYVHRYFKRTTILRSIFNLQRKQLCLLSGDLETIDRIISFTSLSDVTNRTTFAESKSYFLKVEKEKRQYYWNQLCNLGCPILDIHVRDGTMELLRYKHCKNLSGHISFDGGKYSDNELLEEIRNVEKTIIVITGDPGIGKTSFLKWFCNNYYSDKYVIFYDLINFQIYLNKSEKQFIDPLEFIFKEMDKSTSTKYSNFLSGMWKKKKLVCVLDAFDEVRSAYEKQVLEFIRRIADSEIQIVIATRLADCKILIDHFYVQIIKIEPLEGSTQSDYLSLWKLNEDLFQNISPELTTNPLHLNFLRMISISQEKFLNITKFTLYEKVISMKIRRCLQRTTRVLYSSELERTMLLFEKLALVVMFGKKTIEQELMWTSDKEISDYTKFGIVDSFEDENYPVFHHYIFVEFLVAQWITKNHQIKIYKGTVRYLYKQLINENKLHILNILFEDSNLHKSILQTDIDNIPIMIKEIPKCLDVVDKLGRTALHVAIICCGCSHRLRVSYEIVEIIVKSMLLNHNDMEKCDIARLKWTDYFQLDTLDFAELFGMTEIIKIYLSLQRRNIERYGRAAVVFPLKRFNSLFQKAVKSASGDMIADLLLSQYFGNKMFYNFYYACVQNNTQANISNKAFVIEGKLSLIHIACIYGSVPMIQHLIQSNADVNAVDDFGCTPLYYSIMQCALSSPEKTTKTFTCRGGNATKLLLDAGANPDFPNYFSTVCPLCLAIKVKQANLVRMLLENGVSTCCCSKDRNTPLHLAVMNACADIVQCLLEYRAPTFFKNMNGETPMDIAKKQGLTTICNLLAVAAQSEDMVDNIIEDVSIVVGLQCKVADIGHTPLHYAASCGNINRVKALLRKGADVNVRNKRGNTPLTKSIIGDNIDVAILLLDKGAEVNAQNKYGETALYAAVHDTKVNFVELLLKKGADANIRKMHGHTILHAAVQGGSIDIVKMLVKAGATINVQNNDAIAPLHMAAEYQYADIVQYFLQSGAQHNTQNDIGNTALHNATFVGNINIVKLLLKGGANINIRNKQGHAALQLATIKRNADAVKLLLEWGANPNVQDIDGYTPLHIVATFEGEIIAKFLLEKGADINTQSKNGDSALSVAANIRNINMLQLLFEAKVQIDCKGGGAVLRLAASQGYLDIIVQLLKKGVSINSSDEHGYSPLHIAAAEGQVEVVTLLLQYGANLIKERENVWVDGVESTSCMTTTELILDNVASIPAADNENSDTLLLNVVNTGKKDIIRNHVEKVLNVLLAACKTHFSINKSLIRKIVDVNLSGIHGITPLHVAVKHGQIDVVRLLLQANAYVNANNKNGFTSFHSAVVEGHMHIAGLLADKGANINALFKGATALHYSIFKNDVAFVKLLVKKGIDVNVREENGLSAVHLSVIYAQENVLQVLLDGGADFNAKFPDGDTPIFLAAKKGNVNMVRLLLGKGACTLIGNENNSTLLHYSVCEGKIDIVKLLLDNMDVNAQDSFGHTALHIAVASENLDIVRLLLNRNVHSKYSDAHNTARLLLINGQNVNAEKDSSAAVARLSLYTTNTSTVTSFIGNKTNVNLQTKQGSTPLQFAVEKENVDIIRLLLKDGANATIVDSNGKTPLHCAIFQQRTDIVSLLLEKVDDANVQGKSGYTPLHLAAYVQNVDIVRLLLEAEVTVNVQNVDGNTPLHIAVGKRNADIVALLLEIGADIDIAQEDGDTSLHFAVYQNLVDITRLLLRKGGNVNAQNVDGDTPLHIAAQVNSVDIAKMLIDKGANVNAQDEIGRSPLHNSVIKQRVAILQFLLQRGANVNLKSKMGVLALHLAIWNQNITIIELLLENGANVDARIEIYKDLNLDKQLCDIDRMLFKQVNDMKGNTPLQMAIECQHEGIVKSLLRKGANTNLRNNFGQTGLHLAVLYERVDIIKLLLRNSTNITVQDHDGNTPIHLAARKDNTDTMSLLLKEGNNANIQNSSGCTPLHLSTVSQNIDIIWLLLEAGVSVNIQEKEGQTPLHYAVKIGNIGIIILLLEMEADVNIIDNNGDSPLHFAIFEGYTDIVSLLLDKEENINIQNHGGSTLLHLGVMRQNTDIVKLILNKGVEVNSKDKQGNTGLHLAVANENTDIIRLLIEHGAWLNIKNENTETPLDLAVARNRTDIVNVLLNEQKIASIS